MTQSTSTDESSFQEFDQETIDSNDDDNSDDGGQEFVNKVIEEIKGKVKASKINEQSILINKFRDGDFAVENLYEKSRENKLTTLIAASNDRFLVGGR